jgi:hypothetical protein
VATPEVFLDETSFVLSPIELQKDCGVNQRNQSCGGGTCPHICFTTSTMVMVR